ncbi:MAG: amidophosphoribosyltransferase, partial [Tannerella sp.]|nr:amidophosphoribosyltransferase [Tannerella sp.]
KYASTNTEQYRNLVECIRKKLSITTLKFNTLEDLVKAIGLPKECICTHCYDNSGYF